MALEKSFICSANLESNNKKSKYTIASFDHMVEMSFEEGLFFLLCRWLFCGFYIIFFQNPHPKQCTQSMFSQIQNQSSGFCLNLTCQRGETEIEALHLYCIHFYFDSNGHSGELIACFYFSLRGGCTATGEATILIGSWKKTGRYKVLKKAAERPSPCYE